MRGNWALAVAALVSAVLLAYAPWAENSDVGTIDTLHDTRQLVARASRVDTLAMSAPHPVLANYDSLVQALKLCQQATDPLARQSDLSDVMSRFSTRLAKRSRQIDDLKSQHAAQSNARRSLVPWLATAESSDADVERLREALAVYLLAPQNKYESALLALVKPLETRADLQAVLRQVRVMVSTQRALIRIIPDVLREPLAEEATAVAERAAELTHARRQRSALSIKFGLLLLALVCLVGLWWRPRTRLDRR